tara:strand:- start:8375 stop:9058 length:684 start_codon:yes stop_codon:yes gene_type:complete
MFTDYFKIIRQALSESREKGKDQYYEAHHIVPKSFNKNSSTVLLTPEEHYRVHKILANKFKDHPLYGEKMLWAFHRMTYSGEAELSEEEYAIARKALMKLWKRNKKQDWKLHMSEKMKGNKNGIGGKDNWIPTEEQRKRYADAAIKRQTGKVGEESRASKGIVVCENKITGEKIEAGSALQLATKLNMNCSVFHEVLNGSKYGSNPKPKSTRSKYYQFLQDHKIYYK